MSRARVAPACSHFRPQPRHEQTQQQRPRAHFGSHRVPQGTLLHARLDFVLTFGYRSRASRRRLSLVVCVRERSNSLWRVQAPKDSPQSKERTSSQHRKRYVLPHSSHHSSDIATQEKEYASDNLDDTDTEKPPPTKKRKLTKAQEAKQKAAAKKAAAAKKKGKKGNGDDDDYSDEDEDAYTALSKMWKDETRPPNGGFCTCAKCGKQFTVVSPSFPPSPSPPLLHHHSHLPPDHRRNTHNQQPNPPATSATPASNPPPPPPTPSKSLLHPESARPRTREASRILRRDGLRVWRRCAWGS